MITIGAGGSWSRWLSWRGGGSASTSLGSSPASAGIASTGAEVRGRAGASAKRALQNGQTATWGGTSARHEGQVFTG